jgi:hypothetical protein
MLSIVCTCVCRHLPPLLSDSHVILHIPAGQQPSFQGKALDGAGFLDLTMGPGGGAPQEGGKEKALFILGKGSKGSQESSPRESRTTKVDILLYAPHPCYFHVAVIK